MAAQPHEGRSGIEAELRRAREFLDRHAPAEALSLATALLEHAGENRGFTS